MDSNLNALEAKVLAAVDLIKELREENERLGGRCTELEAGVQELQDDNDRLKVELDEARHSAADVEMYEVKRKEIEDKVGGLLEQLEALG
ncbi:MAG: cell division protein ZapB [bacterium]|nr:cell division protein ZapB [bacterium]